MTARPADELTPSSFRHLVDDCAAALAGAGVVGTFAWTVGGRRSPGETWISLASPVGHGRLIRHRDGSFSGHAHSDIDGSTLQNASGPRVTRTDFLALVASLGPSARSVADPAATRVDGR